MARAALGGSERKGEYTDGWIAGQSNGPAPNPAGKQARRNRSPGGCHRHMKALVPRHRAP